MIKWTDAIIKPYIKWCGYRSVCEIGSCHGESVDSLLESAQIKISIIDPCLDTDLGEKYIHNENVKVRKGLSLDVLPKLSDKFDCILIDGDHNWFTVFNELNLIEKSGLLKNGGTIFLHDVGWPYGRRDLYYLPDAIPAEFRHPYAKKGIIYGQSELSAAATATNAGFNNAMLEDGAKNGVLTAVEDFLKEHKNNYLFFYFKQGHGLGILYKKMCFKTYAVFIKWLFIEKCVYIITGFRSK